MDDGTRRRYEMLVQVGQFGIDNAAEEGLLNCLQL